MKMPTRCSLVLLSLFVTVVDLSLAQPIPPTQIDNFAGHPRVIIISDIGNEPDDQMSLVRLLLYSNELDIEALIPTTSTWQKAASHPETMHALIKAYGEVRPNLLLHAQGWPEATYLDQRVAPGQSAYGMAATGPGKSSAGREGHHRHRRARTIPRPVWICLWGGANTLAQALIDVRATRSPAEVDKFVSKLRISSISDQDDAGPWIRREFPNLFYIVQPSPPDRRRILLRHLDRHQRRRLLPQRRRRRLHYRHQRVARDQHPQQRPARQALSPLPVHHGRRYAVLPRPYRQRLERLAPARLGRLGRPLHLSPALRRDPSQSGPRAATNFCAITSQDTVTGVDGAQHISDQATIWRWREAFQNDFAARMDWTIQDFAHANHNPVVVVADPSGKAYSGTAPIYLDAEVGKPIALDASAKHTIPTPARNSITTGSTITKQE